MPREPRRRAPTTSLSGHRALSLAGRALPPPSPKGTAQPPVPPSELAVCGLCDRVMSTAELNEHVPLCRKEARRAKLQDLGLWDVPESPTSLTKSPGRRSEDAPASPKKAEVPWEAACEHCGEVLDVGELQKHIPICKRQAREAKLQRLGLWDVKQVPPKAGRHSTSAPETHAEGPGDEPEPDEMWQAACPHCESVMDVDALREHAPRCKKEMRQEKLERLGRWEVPEFKSRKALKAQTAANRAETQEAQQKLEPSPLLKAACAQCKEVLTLEELEIHAPLCRREARQQQLETLGRWDVPEYKSRAQLKEEEAEAAVQRAPPRQSRLLKAACAQCRRVMTLEELEWHVPHCREAARVREADERMAWTVPDRFRTQQGRTGGLVPDETMTEKVEARRNKLEALGLWDVSPPKRAGHAVMTVEELERRTPGGRQAAPQRECDERLTLGPVGAVPSVGMQPPPMPQPMTRMQALYQDVTVEDLEPGLAGVPMPPSVRGADAPSARWGPGPRSVRTGSDGGVYRVALTEALPRLGALVDLLDNASA